jgi:hypothetical protein
MSDKNNILDRRELKCNPFSVPEGYFDTVEDVVRERISTPEKSGFAAILKPALLLACMFGIIFGIGYGALSLTGTLNKEDKAITAESAEEYYINSRLIDHFAADMAEQDDDEQAVSSELGEEEIISFLSEELSSAQLTYILADLQ